MEKSGGVSKRLQKNIRFMLYTWWFAFNNLTFGSLKASIWCFGLMNLSVTISPFLIVAFTSGIKINEAQNAISPLCISDEQLGVWIISSQHPSILLDKNTELWREHTA